MKFSHTHGIGLGLVALAVLVGIIANSGTAKPVPASTVKTAVEIESKEPVTVWELVKVNDGGQLRYGLRYCSSGRCHWTGYRWDLDDLESATEKWKQFAQPDPDPTVVEVVK